MNKLLIIDETILAGTWILAIFLVIRLIESKDGHFRKLMIWYFVVEVYIYFALFMYLLFYPDAPIVRFIPFVLPKTIVKIFIYKYLNPIVPHSKKIVK